MKSKITQLNYDKLSEVTQTHIKNIFDVYSLYPLQLPGHIKLPEELQSLYFGNRYNPSLDPLQLPGHIKLPEELQSLYFDDRY